MGQNRGMRSIGLIGGMSWESSAEYYRLVNELTRDRLGGLHNAESLLLTVDFAEIEDLQRAGDWKAAGRRLADAAVALERGGADLVALCTNTMHLVADEVEAALSVPFVHLIDTVAEAVRAAGQKTVGLLGTRFTMEMGFYAERMAEHGVEVRVPPEDDRAAVHEVIYGELARGVVRPESRTAYRGVMTDLADAGCEGIVLGCTEIPLLVGAEDSPVPVFDSTRLHAERLVDLALA